jgi:hypothetical protein
MLRYLSLTSVLSFSLLLSLTGCKSDDDSGPPAGRGSDACREWQGAICDFSDRCTVASSADVEKCRHQAPGITCKSDEQASNCVAQLSNGACTQATGLGCDLRDLADPAPATAACNQFLDALCSAAERCGQSTKAACLADPQLSTTCTGVIGHTLDFEQCIKELGALSCTANDAPAICDGVILK